MAGENPFASDTYSAWGCVLWALDITPYVANTVADTVSYVQRAR